MRGELDAARGKAGAAIPGAGARSRRAVRSVLAGPARAFHLRRDRFRRVVGQRRAMHRVGADRGRVRPRQKARARPRRMVESHQGRDNRSRALSRRFGATGAPSGAALRPGRLRGPLAPSRTRRGSVPQRRRGRVARRPREQLPRSPVLSHAKKSVCVDSSPVSDQAP